MNGCLLDTNVLSEVMRVSPNPKILNFFADLEDAWLSVITLHELEYGIERLPAGRKRSAIKAAMASLASEYEDRTLAVGASEACLAALIRGEAYRRGRTVHMADALIAATAKERNLAVVTRNISDFVGLGVDLIDPWNHGGG